MRQRYIDCQKITRMICSFEVMFRVLESALRLDTGAPYAQDWAESVLPRVTKWILPRIATTANLR